MHPAVFLDRDDTLIECRTLPAPPPPAAAGDLIDPARVRLLPGVAEALGDLAAGGFRLVVFSNQGVVARGGTTIAGVRAVNDALRRAVLDQGGPAIDAVYFCPFHPSGSVPEFTREHPWRKPAPGMILAAAGELDLDLSRSWVVGDAPRDIQAGLAAGLAPDRCLLVGEGADLADVSAAAEVILARAGGPVMVAGEDVSRLVLRAMEAALLERPRTRATVVAMARALAERSGLRLAEARVEGGALHVGLVGDRLQALGLVGEIRRAGNAWHGRRHGCALWPGDEA